MATEFEFSITEDTYNGQLEHVLMHEEVRASSISSELDRVWYNTQAGAFGFVFAEDLTSEEEQVLQQKVAAHRGY